MIQNMAGKAPLLLAGVLYFIGMVGLTVTSVDEVPLRAFQQRADVYPSDEPRVSNTRPPGDVPAFQEPLAEASAPEPDQAEEQVRLFAFASSSSPAAVVEPPASAPEVAAPPPAAPPAPAPRAPSPPLPSESPNASAAAVDAPESGPAPLPTPENKPDPPAPPPPPASPPPDDDAVEPPPAEPAPGKSVGKAVANDRARERAAESSAVFSSTSNALKRSSSLQALPPGQIDKKDK